MREKEVLSSSLLEEINSVSEKINEYIRKHCIRNYRFFSVWTMIIFPSFKSLRVLQDSQKECAEMCHGTSLVEPWRFHEQYMCCLSVFLEIARPTLIYLTFRVNGSSFCCDRDWTKGNRNLFWLKTFLKIFFDLVSKSVIISGWFHYLGQFNSAGSC